MNYLNLGRTIMDVLRVKEKERADLILEPMQVMIQLALLAHSPVGTKVSVNNNILSIQPPTITQGVVRWWNNDNKDDLYYLFHAIRRYYKWYNTRECEKCQYILDWAVKGINKLSQTYTKADKNNIRHTLALYKNVLDLQTEGIFKDDTEDTITIDQAFKEITRLYDKKILSVIHNSLRIMEKEKNTDFMEHYVLGLSNMLIPMNIKIRKWIVEQLSC